LYEPQRLDSQRNGDDDSYGDGYRNCRLRDTKRRWQWTAKSRSLPQGKIITVAEPAVAAHERHGDDPALCENEETPPVPPDGTTPELTTMATASVTLDNPISDTATLSGATSDATGTMTFKLYGPFTGNDPSQDQCTADKLVFETVPSPGIPSHVPIGSPNAQGNYVVESPTFTPTAVGRYQWVVSYSGDAKNEAVSSECKAPNEASLVTELAPTSTTG